MKIKLLLTIVVSVLGVACSDSNNNQFDGEWSGVTSQGKLISFKISNNQVARFHFAYVAQDNSVSEYDTPIFSSSIVSKDNLTFALELSPDTFRVDGDFESETQSVGDLSMVCWSNLYCLDTVITWNAAK